MASTLLGTLRPSLLNGILKEKKNKVFTRTVFPSTKTRTVFPSTPFTTERIPSLFCAVTRQISDNGNDISTRCHINDAANTELEPLRIGIIGLGNFGKFIAKGFQRQGHYVLATSRTDYSEYCLQNGIQYFRNIEALCEQQPDVILVCTSISSTKNIVRSIPIHKLKPDTIFADVLSVKQLPKDLFLEILPPSFGIACTHPMFGPVSGKNGWNRLPFVFEIVRVNDTASQRAKCMQFLNIFEKEGCQMVEMSCEEHDCFAAGTQFLAHTIGRTAALLNLKSTPINTKGYEILLHLIEMAISDSFDLYLGLFIYNPNAIEQLDNLERAFKTVKQMIYDELQDVLRKQIVVESVPIDGTSTTELTD